MFHLINKSHDSIYYFLNYVHLVLYVRFHKYTQVSACMPCPQVEDEPNNSKLKEDITSLASEDVCFMQAAPRVKY